MSTTTIVDVSSKLGEYMLKGWVLTDRSCATRGCNVPLMRSPNGTVPVVHFCANCDGHPDTKHQSDSASSASSSSQHHTISRSSTPPTEVSSTPSSPTFAPPEETPESRRRREQSDRASAEIGNRLLKGWAMLGEECPNTQCFGIPLVRPPKAGGEKDPRKECVICGGVFMSERDWLGREQLVPAIGDPSANTVVKTTSRPESNVNQNTTQLTEAVSAPVTSTSTTTRAMREILQADAQKRTGNGIPTQQGNTRTTQSALSTTVEALELTLVSLSSRLTSLASTPATVDPVSLSSISDAIIKATQALSQVKQLQWSERQAFAG